MSGTVVTAANGITTVVSYVIDALQLRPLITGGVNATQVPLTDDPCGLYVRRDRKNRHRQVNVFDHNGIKCYTIERWTQFSPIWRLLEFPSRREIATINASLGKRSVDFHNKRGLQHRVLKHRLGKLGRRFYLTDGALYGWSRTGKYLEKIINPGGGDEEVHERIAKARLMRQFRFDYELLYDPNKIDREIALATGFVSMVTEWGMGAKIETRGPTLMRKSFNQPPPPIIQHELVDTEATGEVPQQLQDDDCVCDNAPPQQQDMSLPQSVENRVFLIVEKPDGTRTAPLEITQGTDNYSNPLLQLTDAPEPEYIRVPVNEDADADAHAHAA
ncbi:hypothetical protein TRICI_000335 [Trichomonascus ciferrii]|uniref:Uncharacterized protein n=1 Tax=Trichomonascus ciferrii TaxID=44093 RepID=A0A642VDP0_9ASCO|nr:hypothetical protein TRICI_000335 [Trichomonascus ciferrii]